jgi:hypothetical protein
MAIENLEKHLILAFVNLKIQLQAKCESKIFKHPSIFLANST